MATRRQRSETFEVQDGYLIREVVPRRGKPYTHRCSLATFEHVAHAIDSDAPVGFFWGDDTDTARPDAWCAECDRKLRALNGASCEQWFVEAEFKILCAACWDEARWVLYERHRH